MNCGGSAVCKICGSGMGGPKCRTCRYWERRVSLFVDEVLTFADSLPNKHFITLVELCKKYDTRIIRVEK